MSVCEWVTVLVNQISHSRFITTPWIHSSRLRDLCIHCINSGNVMFTHFYHLQLLRRVLLRCCQARLIFFKRHLSSLMSLSVNGIITSNISFLHLFHDVISFCYGQLCRTCFKRVLVKLSCKQMNNFFVFAVYI